MFSNYIKIALRSLVRNKFSSFLNIMGLSIGISVAMLIGIWIHDELSYNKNFSNYDRIAQVMQNFTMNGQKGTGMTIPYPMAQTLRQEYGSQFKYVTMASWNSPHTLSIGDKRLTQYGTFLEPSAMDMLDLQMLQGTRSSLTDPSSILISSSCASAVFGSENPIGKLIKLDTVDVKVTGLYPDFPENSSFAGVNFISNWQLFAIGQGFSQMADPWRCNCFLAYAQVADNADMKKVSAAIKNLKLNKIDKSELTSKPEIFLHPMSQWHLHEAFENGQPSGGRIQYVWLFGLIGAFVLLLACINFMNLSTARSEKRAKEVGIRKSIGSARLQLIFQFFSESLLLSFFAFLLSLLFVQLALPFFNDIAGKKMHLLWGHPLFWLTGIGFSLLTGLLAGSYPALYLSSFNPVQVLKGSFRAGPYAAVPRKMLVVLQFTVSVVLIIGTIIVFRQIQFAKNRPVGYSPAGLINIQMMTTAIHTHFDVVKQELMQSGTIASMSESGSPTTEVWSTNAGFDWKGKDPGLSVDFPNTDVSYDYGKTVGWQFTLGRDFSKEFKTDSAAFIINESAVKYMGLKNPVGEIIKWDGIPYTIVGVIKNMLVESPYQAVRPALFHLSGYPGSVTIIRLNPNISAASAMANLEKVFKKYNPSQPFDYQFVDEAYGRKFGDEERIGKLAGIFAALAIFISCLGLFGMASFVAAQRTKEIGVRKILGASVFILWQLLSTDFVRLILLACVLAIPIAHFALRHWLDQYAYRTDLSWWVFAVASAGALGITLITVSFHAIKAAIANPVSSLRSE